MKKFILLILLFWATYACSQTSTFTPPGQLTTEEDGTPSLRCIQYKFSNNSVTDNADGTCSIAGGGGGGGGTPLEIQNNGSTLHTNALLINFNTGALAVGSGQNMTVTMDTTIDQTITGAWTFMNDLTVTELGHACQAKGGTNNTLRVCSSDTAQANDYVEMYHDKFNAYVNVGEGILFFNLDEPRIVVEDSGTVAFNITADSTTYNQAVLSPEDASGNQIIITHDLSALQDHDHAQTTDPTLFIHSDTAPDTANDQWISLAHDKTTGVFTSGLGGITLDTNTIFTGQATFNDALEVDGVSTFNQQITVGGSSERISGTTSYIDFDDSGTDTVTMSGTMVVLGLKTASNFLLVMEQTDLGDADLIPTTAATNPTLRIVSGDQTSDEKYVDLSHNGTDAVLASGLGAIFLDADEEIFMDANYGTFRFRQTGTTVFEIRAVTTNDEFKWGLPAASGRQFVITDQANAGQDHDHDTPTNPTMFIHSATAPDSANDEWIGLSHDVTNGRIELGSGQLVIPSNITVTGSTSFNGVNYTWPANAGSNGQVLHTNGTDTLTWAADDTGGGGGGSGSQLFYWSPEIQSAKLNLDAGHSPQIEGGGQRWSVLYDADTIETASWMTTLDTYAGGGFTGTIDYSMASGESDEVEWQISIDCYTPNTDSTDIDSPTWGTADSLVDTVSASAGRAFTISDASLNEDSCALGDILILKVDTDADDGSNDDATGDRELRGITIHEN